LTFIVLVVATALCLNYEPCRNYGRMGILLLLIAFPFLSLGLLILAGISYRYFKE
jgi:hypothetical protein